MIDKSSYPRPTETYELHCNKCFLRFEDVELSKVVKKVDDHEKVCNKS